MTMQMINCLKVLSFSAAVAVSGLIALIIEEFRTRGVSTPARQKIYEQHASKMPVLCCRIVSRMFTWYDRRRCGTDCNLRRRQLAEVGRAESAKQSLKLASV